MSTIPIADLVAVHENEIAARLARAEEAHRIQGHGNVVAMIPTNGPDEETIAKALDAAGYGSRAIKAIAHMEGPALSIARTLVPKVVSDGMLLIIGPTGRGKTVMAAYFARTRIRSRLPAGKFLTAHNLFAQMKQCWNGKGADSEVLLDRWKKCPFLVIDEVQTRGETVWENSVLDDLINDRYANERPTVLMGNFANEAEAQKSLGPRIMDRANEAGGIVECTWPSYRQ